MSFSSEEHIEEILWNAHQKGIVENLRKEVDDYIKNNPRESLLDAYIYVYNKLTQNVNISEK